MAKPLAKFATQADPDLLDQIRAIAGKEGKQLQSVIDEALRDFVDKRTRGKARPEVLTAFGESLAEFDALYKELAK
jgi:predicted transcriptional regulator